MKLYDQLLERGRVSAGNSEDLERFRNKLKNKEAITYAAIGGSITQGAAASAPRVTAFAPLFASWLQQHTECRFINAGAGATTSMFGAFRCQQEILKESPDIITVEFAVNDTINPDTEASYEALVRQCLNSPKRPLVILLFTMRQDGTNLQAKQIPIGQHYALPMLSYRDAVYPEIQNGARSWESISPDDVHPNDTGHAFIAAMLEHFVTRASPTKGKSTFPDPLHPESLKYLAGKVIDAPHMEILENHGWQQFEHHCGFKGLESKIAGSRLKVRLTGGALLLGYVKYAGDFGMISVKVNNQTIRRLDGYYEKPEIQKWAGGHTLLESLADTPQGSEHIVEIELLQEHNPKSKGHHFKIGYFLAGQ